MGKKVLISVLDWGLGHATRCVPIIDYYTGVGCKVVLAGDGQSLSWLKERYPDLVAEVLPSYQVKYSQKVAFAVKMILSLPKIYKAISAEQKQVKRLHAKYGFDLILSDNRYGVYVPGVPSYFMGHQLNIRFPYFQKQVFVVQRYLLRYFKALLVPDYPTKQNLAGELSRLKKGQDIKLPIFHLGALSRFYNKSFAVFEPEYELVAMVSGPEPYKSSLVKQLIEMADGVSGEVVLLTHDVMLPEELPSNLTVVLNPSDGEFLEKVLRSKVFLSRPGYSTLMDMVYLQRKCFFVPTPGQTEQEYLARYLSENNWGNYCEQKHLSWDKIVVSEGRIPFNPQNFSLVLEKLLK